MEPENDHGKLAEDFIDCLCQKHFFKDFTVRSPKYKKQGLEKEICDILVVFNDILLNFQVKSKIETKPFSQKQEKDISRITRKISAAIEQLKELKSIEKNKLISELTTTRGITIPFPSVITQKIGIICLNLVGEDRFPDHEHTDLVMPYKEEYEHEIHCFKSEILGKILEEQTTLPDFLRYLEFRKIFLTNNAIISFPDELDFLAAFKGNYADMEKAISQISQGETPAFFIEQGLWESYKSNHQVLANRKDDNEVSQWYDELIDLQFQSIGFQPIASVKSGIVEDYWYLISILSKLDRLKRRTLSEQCFKKAVMAINSERGFNYCLIPMLDLKIAFVYLAFRKNDREQRINTLKLLCIAATLRIKDTPEMKDIQTIIGIATEPANCPSQSCDKLIGSVDDFFGERPNDQKKCEDLMQIFGASQHQMHFEFRHEYTRNKK